MNRASCSAGLAGALVITLLCAACGGGGGGSAPVTPPPAVTPTITTGPVSQNVVAGASVTFSVAGSGSAPLSYQWQRNGVDVAGATAASVVLPAAALGDTRTTWHAVVRNSAGSVTSADATLKVSGIGVLAGLPGTLGNVDGAAGVARLGYVAGLAIDAAGVLSASDVTNGALRRITPDGAISTVLGGLATPSGVAVDTAGNVYVAESGNGNVRKITPAGAATIFATLPLCTERGIALYRPSGLAVDAAGNLFVASGVALYRINSAGFTEVAEGGGLCREVGDTAPYVPRGIVVDGAGNLLVGGESGPNTSNAVYRVAPFGAATYLAGGLAEIPRALAIDAQGNAYLPSQVTHAIVRIALSGVASVIAGVAGSDGVKPDALPGGLSNPSAIAVDKFGDVYVASAGAILKIQLP